MSNLDDFIIHSQYPVEKIVWTAEGNLDSTNPNWHEVEGWGGRVFEPLPESLNWQNLLVDGLFSFDDWQTAFVLDSDSKPVYISQNDEVGFVWVSANTWAKGFDFFGYILPTNCAIFSGDNSNTAGRTLKYKIWAYLVESDWESSTTTKTAETLAYKLQKDTRLAQLNMLSENNVKVPNNSTKVLYHNLGFRPFCKIWCRTWKDGAESQWSKILYTTTLTPATYSLINNTITIDNEKITITTNDQSEQEYRSDDFEYLIRIYNYAIPQ